MAKILGKSALCFAGLAIASWLIQMFCDWILYLYPKELFFGLISIFILELIFWLLLPLTYAYLLFLLFKKEKHCYLILVLNGVFVIVQYYILLMLHINGDIILASLQASKVAGVPVMILALIFKKLRTHNIDKDMPEKSKLASALFILTKSLLCFLALAITTYAFTLLSTSSLRFLGYLSFFVQDPLCAFPLISIAYVYLLFRLIRTYRYHLLTISITAVFLMALSAVRLFIVPALSFYHNQSLSLPAFLSELFTPNAVAIFGNTAILLPILALIFRSVEKQSVAVESTNQNMASDSITPTHSDIQN